MKRGTPKSNGRNCFSFANFTATVMMNPQGIPKMKLFIQPAEMRFSTIPWAV